MPLPYGWDHEAIAAKLRVLGKEGYPSKQRYAIAMDSARSDWMDTHGSAPLPGHLKRVGGIGAKRVTIRAAANMAKGKRRNRASGRMRWWYVSSGFRYVLVRASNETDAARLSKPKFKALDGRAAEVINNVRPATDDELDLYKFHVKNVRKEASYTRNAKRSNRASGKSQDFYVTTYCNHAHRMRDGSPIGHQCRRLPVAALKAERDGDYDKANDILARQSR